MFQSAYSASGRSTGMPSLFFASKISLRSLWFSSLAAMASSSVFFSLFSSITSFGGAAFLLPPSTAAGTEKVKLDVIDPEGAKGFFCEKNAIFGK